MTDDAYARYFIDRELFERTMSYSSANHKVAAVHHEMAQRYEALARVFGAQLDATHREEM
jgi:hypothetical protein